MTHNPPATRGCRRVAPAGESNSTSISEKTLANGDVYRGCFSGGSPHGRGKYLWSDGCMYEGDWRRGKANGKGKFSWPSGATYEGEFRGGRMEGFGSFTCPGGTTYRGNWLADRKHGQGLKIYANGDQYEGTWRRNLQEGQGRYTWHNGNQYVGEWKNGVISGRGVLIWANGNRYDGLWENGVPKGSGVFTWPDGSCYVGTWANGSNKDPNLRSINGTFYPAVTKRPSSVDARGSTGSDKIFPRICIWESDGEKGDITCDIIDNMEASLLYKDGYGMDFEKTGRAQHGFQSSPIWFASPEVKKQGEIIFKGHKNYDLMLNLQLGIAYSVGKPVEDPIRELLTGDFDPREKFWTRFPPEGSKNTPPHQSADFRWKDYCPTVFRHLRKLFSVDPADYMLAICGDDALREFSSPGKSGSFFYLTNDDRFMIKTVKKSEVKVLIKMLPSYYNHMSRYENSLVTRFYGVHCVKPIGGTKVRFIVMGNLFCANYRIHRRFDLKGSSYGRTADKFEEEIDETTTLKDLDLNYIFKLQKFWYKQLLDQIKRDCEFLESEGIMDYSLLIGIHFRDDLINSPKILSKCEQYNEFIDLAPDDRKPLIKLGANMPAKAEHLMQNRAFNAIGLDPFLLNGFLSPDKGGEIYEVVLYFGIIDILQDYDISKKLEHAYKSLQVDPNSISAVDPKLYSRRFQDFIGRIFVED